MSRHGYNDGDVASWDLIRWRGQVASAIRGQRGQAFLRELATALDELPQKRLIHGELRKDGEVCALGAVGAKRGLQLETFDVEEPESLGREFGIAHQLVQEIEWQNDHVSEWSHQTPEERWTHVRDWVASQLKEPKP